MIVFWIMLGLLALYLVRTLRGPTVWDRFLGMNLVSTKIIVITVVIASIYERAFILDFAMIYSLLGFIGTIFLALFLSQYKLGKRRGKKEER